MSLVLKLLCFLLQIKIVDLPALPCPHPHQKPVTTSVIGCIMRASSYDDPAIVTVCRTTTCNEKPCDLMMKQAHHHLRLHPQHSPTTISPIPTNSNVQQALVR